MNADAHTRKRAVNDRLNDERAMRMTKSKAVPKPLKSGQVA
jgi:hypothetical protein